MIKRFFSYMFGQIWSVFINGLLTLLPIAITLSVFSFSFKMVKSWLAPLRIFQESIPYLSDIPEAEIFLAFALIFLAGIFLKSFIIRSIIELFELLLEQVPLVRPVYAGVKQLVAAFSPTDTMTFQQVVLVEFPRPGIYSIGFQTSEVLKELSPNPDETYYSIFIPTTPNPTTGYFIMAKKQEFKTVDLTTQEAMALIISGGIIQPKRYKKEWVEPGTLK